MGRRRRRRRAQHQQQQQHPKHHQQQANKQPEHQSILKEAEEAAKTPNALYEPVSLVAEEERRKGNKQYHRKHYAAAVYHYTRGIAASARNPAFLGVLFANRAAAHIGLKNFEACVEDCTAALSLDPQSVKAHGRRAYALYSLKRYADAVKDFEVVLTLEPDNAQVRENLEHAMAKLNKQAANRGSKGSSGSKGSRTSSENSNPLPVARSLLGGTGSGSGSATPQLPDLVPMPLTSLTNSVYARSVCADEPSDPAVLFYPLGLDAAKDAVAVLPSTVEASTLRADGSVAQPHARVGGMGAQSPSSQADAATKSHLVSSPEMLASLGVTAAATSLGSSIHIPAKDAGPTVKLVPVSEETAERALQEKVRGNKRFQAGDLNGALDHYTKAIELNPNNPVFYSNRAHVFLKLERFYDAIHDCSKSIDRGPSFKAYLRRATAWHNLRAFEEASRDFATALRLGARYEEVRPGLERCLYEIEMGFFETYAVNTGVDTTLVQLIQYVQSKMSSMSYDALSIDEYDIERLASCVYSICEVAAEFPFWEYDDDVDSPASPLAPDEDSPWTLSSFLQMALDSNVTALDLSSWEDNPRLVAIMDDYIKRGVIVDDRPTTADNNTATATATATTTTSGSANPGPPTLRAPSQQQSPQSPPAQGPPVAQPGPGDLQAFVTLLTESAMYAAFTVVADFLGAAIPDDHDDAQFLAMIDESSHFQADEPLRVAFQAAQTMLKMQDPATALDNGSIVAALDRVLAEDPPKPILDANYVRALVYLLRAHAKSAIPDLDDLNAAAACEPDSNFIQGLIIAANKQAQL